MRFPLPRRRIWRWLTYWFCLSLVLLAADMVCVEIRRQITAGYDTTRVVAPTLPDGRIDYLAVVENARGAGVTPENNAAVLLLQAFGRGALPPTQPPDGITGILGMPHLPEQGDYLILDADYCKQHSIPNDAPLAPDRWPVTISPTVADWIKANEKPLELVVEASKRPRFFIPFNAGNRPEFMASILLTHVRYMSEVPVLLLSRAMLRLDAGDVAGFHQDVVATARLGKLMGQSTMVEWAMGVDNLQIAADETARAAAASGKLHSADLRSLATDLAAVGDAPPIDGFIDRGERYMVLDFLEAMAAASGSHRGELFNQWLAYVNGSSPPPFLFQFLPMSYEQNMRELNRAFDGALVALQQPSYATRISALHTWQSQIDDQCNTKLLLFSAYFGEKCFMLDVTRSEQKQDTAKMQNRLTQVALALAAFKADHGSYPKTLADLSPEYLAVIPEDSFVDKPLIYAPTDKGYTLYSLGPKMEDHGGNLSNISASLP